jgi:tetratricopeptide (TPR) repeat protein
MSQQLEQRLRALEATLLINSKDAYTHSRIGHVLLQLGRPHEAIKSFTKIMELDAKLPEGPYGAGEVFSYLQEWNKALEFYALALQCNPFHVPTLAGLIRLHETRGEPHLATDYYSSVLKAKPDDIDWQRRTALHYVSRSKWQDALALLEKLDQVPSTDPQITEAHGLCLSNALRWDDTVLVLRPFCSTANATTLARTTLALALEHLADFTSARDLWKLVHDANATDLQATMGLARCDVEILLFREALDVLQSLPLGHTQELESAWLEGRAYLGLGDFTSALRVVQRALTTAPPTESRLYSVAGEALLKLERYDEAAIQLEKAVRYAPNVLRPWLLLAECQCLLKQYDSASKAYEQSTNLAPNDTTVRLAQAVFERDHGTTTRALATYARAYETDRKSTEAALGAANAAFELGDLDNARTWLERTLTLEPAQPDAIKLLGIIQFRTQDVRGALASLQSASVLLPNDPVVWSALAECHHQLGNTQAEYDVLERAHGLTSETDVALRLGIVSIKLRCYERAIEVLTRALVDTPDDSRINYELGIAFEQSGRFNDSRGPLESACQLAPSNVESLHALGRICLRLDDASAAIVALEQAERIEPQSRDIQFELGTAYHHENLLAEAGRVFRELNARFPEDQSILFALGNVLFDSRDDDAAYHYLEKVVVLDATQAQAHQLLGCLAIRNGKAETALAHFRRAAILRPDSPDVLSGIVTSAALANCHEESVRAARQLLRLRPDDPDTLSHLANSLEVLGRDDEAEQTWTRACKGQPQNASFLLRHGLVLHRLRRENDAISQLTAGLAANNGTANHWDALADCYERVGTLTDAVEALVRAAEIEPSHSSRWHRLGRLEQRLGHEPRALVYFTRAYDTGLVNDEVRETISKLHQNQAERNLLANAFEGALTSANMALQFAPDSSDLLALQGRAFFALGKEQDALQALERAETLGHCSVSVLQILANLAEKYDHNDVAERVFRTIIGSESSHEGAWNGLIRTLQKLGKSRDTLDALGQALALRPDDPDLHLKFGSLLYAEHDFIKATSHLRRAIALRRVNGETHHLLASCELAQNHWDLAREAFQLALSLEPSNVDWARELVSILLKQQRHTDVVDTLRPLWQEGLLTTGDVEQLALALVQCGRHEEAIRPLREALAATSRDDLERCLLESFSQIGDTDNVVTTAESILAKTPNDVRALELAADALSRRTSNRDLERAIVLYEQLLGLSPNDTRAKQEIVRLRKCRASQGAATSPELVISDLTRALELHPNDAELHRQMATSLYNSGDLERAAYHARKSIELDDTELTAWLLLGDIDAANGNHANAAASYERAASLSPQETRALQGLFRAALDQKHPEKAATYLERLCALEPGVETHQTKAIALYLELGDNAALVSHLSALSQLRTLTTEELRKLSFLQAGLKQYEAASEHFEQVLNQCPSDLEAIEELAISLVALGRDTDAILWLERLLRMNPNRLEAQSLLGLALSRTGRHEAAVQSLSAVRKQGSNDVAVLRAQVVSLRELRRFADCLVATEALASLEPDSPDVFERIAELQLELDNPLGAIDALERSQQLRPNGQLTSQIFDLLIEQADCEQLRNEHQTAIGLLQRAVSYSDDRHDRLLASARRLYKLSALETASDVLTRARRIGDDYETNLLLGNVWLERKNPREATACFERAITLQIDSSEALLGFGVSQLQIGNLKEAESALLRAVHLKPTDTIIQEHLVEVYLNSGRTDSAIASLRQLLKLKPDADDARLKLGRTLAEQNEHALCIDVLLTSTSFTEITLDAASLLSRSFEATARWTDALNLAEARLVDSPQSPEWLTHRAVALEHCDREQEATVVYEKILEFTPSNESCHERLRDLYVRLGEKQLNESHPEEAARLLELAIRHGNTSANAFRLTARAYFDAGDLHRAQALAEQCAKKDATGEHWLLLGRIESRLGRHEFSVVAFESAASREPNNAEAWAELSLALSRLGRIEVAANAAKTAVHLKPSAENLAALARLLDSSPDRANQLSILCQLERLRALTLIEKTQQAHCHLELGAFNDAIDCFEDAVEISPTDVALLKEFGTTLLRASFTEKAANVLAKAQRLQPDDQSIGELLTSAYFASSQFESAIVAGENTCVHGPNEVTLKLVADSQTALGRHAEAATTLSRLASIEKGTPSALLELGRAHVKAGARSQAYDALFQAYVNSNGSLGGDELLPILITNIEEFIRTDCNERAREQVELALPLAKGKSDDLIQVARFLKTLGFPERALEALSETTKTATAPVAAYRLQAELNTQLSRWAEALICFERVNRESIDDIESLIGIGRCQLALGRDTQAITPLLRATSLRSNDDELAKLARSAIAQEPSKEGRRRDLRKLFEIRPYDREITFELAQLEFELGHHVEVIELINTDAPALHSDTDALLLLAQAQSAIERDDDCRRTCERVLAIRPNDKRILTLLGIVDARTGNVDAAIQALESALAETPSADVRERLYDLYRTRTNALMSADDVAGAERAASRALQLRKDDQTLRLQVAQLQSRLGRVEDEIDTLRAEIGETAEDLDRWLLIGERSLVIGRPDLAVDAFTVAHRIAPNQLQISVKLGVSLARAGKFDAARIELERTLNQQACDPTVLEELATIYFRANDERQACAYLERLRSIRELSPELQRKLGLFYAKESRFENAFAALYPLFLNGFADFELSLTVGQVTKELGRLRESVLALKTAQQLCPERADVAALLGEELLCSDSPAEALEAINRALALGLASLKLHELAAACALRIGDQARWIQSLRARTTLQPNDASLHAELAEALQTVGAFPEAAEALRSATKLKRRPEWFRMLAKCCAAFNDIPGQLSALAAVAELLPTDALAHAEYGLARLAASHFEAAQDALGRALSIDPRLTIAIDPFRESTLRLARTELQNQNASAAYGYYRALVAMPDCPFELLLEHSNCAVRLGYLADARLSLARAHQLQPGDQAVSLQYADLQVRAGHKDDAISIYEATLEANANATQVARALSAIYEEREDFLGAARTLGKVYATEQADVNYVLAYLFALSRAGQPKESLRVCQSAVERNPNSPELLQRLGSLYAEQGHYTQSVDALKRAVRIEPTHPSRFYLLAKILLNANRETDAAEWLELGLQRHRDDPSLVSLFHALAQRAESTNDFVRAARLYKHILALSKPSAIALRGLANALIMLGQPSEAGTLYEQSVTLDPNNAQLRFELGSLYAVHRKRNEATRHWEVLRTLDPNLANRLAQLLVD